MKLEQNYRSTKTILEAAYGVVAHNRTARTRGSGPITTTGSPIVTETRPRTSRKRPSSSSARSAKRSRPGGTSTATSPSSTGPTPSRACFEEVFVQLRDALPDRRAACGSTSAKRSRTSRLPAGHPQPARLGVACARIINVPDARHRQHDARRAGAARGGARARPLWDVMTEAHLLSDLLPRARNAVTASPR